MAENSGIDKVGYSGIDMAENPGIDKVGYLANTAATRTYHGVKKLYYSTLKNANFASCDCSRYNTTN